MTTSAEFQTRTDLHAEFDRQVAVLVQKGYPHAAGVEPAEFLERVSALKDLLGNGGADSAAPYPFVLVITSELVPASSAIELVERRDKPGFSVLDSDDLRRFEPIDAVELPRGPAYLALGVDTGQRRRNVRPDDALAQIEAAGRSPLTIDEGIALITAHPEAVAKNGGFSLAGSRCGDRRVCALWISDSRPKLGWCWAGNPHTWLGTASCAARVGVPVP
ncbi:MAG TPA: DUF5701 family protein [Solirubrobacteraceae bacterium]|jgi:hypothetical protein|nr:DUF5701 family protein [Solirubrobacteraceae bacterium]